MTRHTPELTIPGLLGDFRLLLILFVAFRVMSAIVYQPIVVGQVERGVSAGGDFAYYHALAALTDKGLLPFRDWWSEFPPIASALMVAVYKLSHGAYPAFAMLFGFLMLLCDVGNLVLVRKIGSAIHRPATGMTLAWIYALMLAPAVFLWWNFEPLVAFLLLLGTYWLVAGATHRSAVVVAVGALTKFIPVLLLGAVWRFRSRGAALRYTVIVAALFAVVYALLVAGNSTMTLPSLTAQFGKASYETVWALLDGNFRTGNFGTIADHLNPAAASVLQGNPALMPGVVRLIVAAAIGLFVFVRARRIDHRGLVAFVTLTLLIFFLQSQGWSVQWLADIIPLVLLCFPTRDGVMIAVLLTFLAFAEYPLLFLRTGDTGGVITGALVMPFAVLVIARTAILVGVCVALYRKLRQEPSPDA
jgi:hypothetical protein